MASTPTTDPVRLKDFTAKVCESAGVPAADAGLVAASLVQADPWGHQSHGVLRAGWYLERLRRGTMTAVTDPAFVADAGAVAVMDGRDGIGQVRTARALDEAARRAKAHGIGAVAVRNSNHFGTCISHTVAGARRGCVTFLASNGGPTMAPWGGTRKIVGTDPWSFAGPAGRHAPMVSDTGVAGQDRPRPRSARAHPGELGDRWPHPAHAGQKGYAIATVMDMMAGVLTGSAFPSGVNGPTSPTGRAAPGTGSSPWTSKPSGRARISTHGWSASSPRSRASPRAQGFDAVFSPGEIEVRSDTRHRRDGLTPPDDTRVDLARIAGESGLDVLPW